MQHLTESKRRQNLRLGWGLFLGACLVALSIFAWRFAHHAAGQPDGSSYNTDVM